MADRDSVPTEEVIHNVSPRHRSHRVERPEDMSSEAATRSSYQVRSPSNSCRARYSRNQSIVFQYNLPQTTAIHANNLSFRHGQDFTLRKQLIGDATHNGCIKPDRHQQPLVANSHWHLARKIKTQIFHVDTEPLPLSLRIITLRGHREWNRRNIQAFIIETRTSLRIMFFPKATKTTRHADVHPHRAPMPLIHDAVHPLACGEYRRHGPASRAAFP